MSFCPSPSSSGKSPANESATRSLRPRKRACGWAACRHWVMTSRTASWSSTPPRPALLSRSTGAISRSSRFTRCGTTLPTPGCWTVLPALYDDGGVSGGTMERPALKRLIADIEAGQIDVVVVHKVDRLTRALSDFAKLVEVFDRRGVSFVSITQQFNTTTSMGRLTLNVLL